MDALRKMCICALLTIGILVPSVAGATDKWKVQNGHVYQVQTVTKSNLHWYSNIMPTVVKNESHALMRWNTTSTDVTATWPDATDPTRKLPIKAQVTFACIRYHESRNHLTSVEMHSYAGGWYQFIPYIWNFARGHIPGLPAKPQMATAYQQSAVAVWYYQRNHGFYPEWGGDMKVCG